MEFSIIFPPLSSSSLSSQHPPLFLVSTRIRKNGKTQLVFRRNLALQAVPSPDSSNGTIAVEKKRRKLRPSFFDQTVERWSRKVTSKREKFPWEVEKGVEGERGSSDICSEIGGRGSDGGCDNGSGNVGMGGIRVVVPPWAHGDGVRSRDTTSQMVQDDRKGILPKNGRYSPVEKLHISGNTWIPAKPKISNLNFSPKTQPQSLPPPPQLKIHDFGGERVENSISDDREPLQTRSMIYMNGIEESENVDSGDETETTNPSPSSSVRSPWDIETKKPTIGQRTNTELAERTIPEPELRRLRNMALKMKERSKVGYAGVTTALVKSIRSKWMDSEVVKLKFEGPAAINMKRTHITLEEKTRGLVIWRSGASLVLYRGMAYNIQQHVDTNHGKKPEESTSNMRLTIDENSLVDGSDINDDFLDELGPRYEDWSGRKPLPIDADLLPSVIRGYKPPLRFLPFKTKLSLRDKEMTYLRRFARTIPPHFALGRSRNNQGLAKAMVKLWEKSLIAKIAIKRGVVNTSNERMSEELKVLTGGLLLSRNKEFMVFYRGNDFLTPAIAKVVEEREKLSNIRQEEEDLARQRASDSIIANIKMSKLRLVAGTLAETVEAKARWTEGDMLSEKDRKKMVTEAALTKHASLIRFMEKKLTDAKEKVRKAERALAKVQEFLDPVELPGDLETLTDEEYFIYRNIGLKMKSFLSLGRRGIFDGTIENMHLNWKHRELVKIIVKKGKSFEQVKHLAISLEAESGGVLISLDKTTKGYAIVVYRGKNYERPAELRPPNLLTRRQALERAIELQRREALKGHILKLQKKIDMMKSELEKMVDKKDLDDDDDDDDDDILNENSSSTTFDLGDDIEEEGDEAYLETYFLDDNDGDVY
ncbi:Chloroplastic group IIA intron splicing facilitator CRS1 [Zostera marina]|uniref:Chloroplastic group IIA intron splicing facilitator CRS1 n=1 Tax=Zostera marina TaxID=29655 RepID=A0A0K9P337_ZOSMR|nr:Chloroplastic group IIA intron splicing facilitator CRS1 [Zostera marina]